MHRVLSILFIALLTGTALTGGIGAVAAQEGNDSVDIEESPEETDEASISAEDLWTLLKESDDADRPEEQSLLTDLGPNLYVTDLEFDDRRETATITVVARVTTRVTITDATAFDRSSEVSVAESRGMTIPRGTFKLAVPATVRDDGNQAVTVAPGNNQIYMLSNEMVREGTHIFDGRPVWSWFAWFTAAVIGGVALYLVRRIRKLDTGAVETSDGTKLTGDIQLGLVDVPEPDEGGDDDE